MKKTRIFAIISLILLMAALVPAKALAEGTEVYVTIADKNGELVLAEEKILVTDTDKDDIITVNDVLTIAHEKKYKDKAAGYETAAETYGLCIKRLWGGGEESGFGYYINNQMAYSLTDAVKSGDYVNAYVYTDSTFWSDQYTFFNVNTIDAKAGDSVTLTLSGYSFDENFNTITLPVKGAVIMLDGKSTEVKTDDEGKATITLGKAKRAVISAKSETEVIVPPVCVANVKTSSTAYIIVIIAAVIVVGAAAFAVVKNRKKAK